MSFKPAKCPNCAGDLQVPEDRDTVKCMYCGSDIVVREAIKLAAGGVNIENLLMLAKTAESSQKREEAYKYYSKVLEYDTNNIDAWIGKGFSCASGSEGDYKLAGICFQKAIGLSTDQHKTRDMIITKIKQMVPTHMELLQGQFWAPTYNYLSIIHDLNPDDVVGLVAKAAIELVASSSTSDHANAIAYYKKALDLSKRDKQITKVIVFNIAYSRCFGARTVVAPYLNKGQDLISFVHEIYPDDRPIEKYCIKQMYDFYRYRSGEGYFGGDKEVFHNLLKEIQQVDPRFNIGKIPECFKTGCFIATAAYGSPLAPEVKLLREFRDRQLEKKYLGKLLVRFYYQISPPIAMVISNSNILKRITMLILKPLIMMINKFHKGD
jgi:tetratricopeptide (TPR) repeat protein